MFPFTANHTFTFTPRFPSAGDIPTAAAAKVRSDRIVHVPCQNRDSEFELESFPCSPLHGQSAVAEKPQQHCHHPRESERKLRPLSITRKKEMKFSHSIQFNAVPDWSSHYIAYSNLKKL